MNLVLIVSDTFRWDYLGAYGNAWIRTPDLDRLAAQSAVFLDAYAEGLPTLPARRVIMTGRNIVPFVYRPQKSDLVQLHGWHPLYDEDVTLAEHLRERGFVCALFNDVYHMMKPGKNFHRGFDGWYWIRGQEDDPFALRDRQRVAEDLARASRGGDVGERAWIIQHLVNRQGWRSEADTSVAKVMRTAADWLRDYSLPQPFYMHVECFDPHEPWDPPAEYARLYDPEFDSLDGLIPPGTTAGLTPEQVRNVRTAYAGEVSLVDRWIGHLLDTLEATGHADDTVVVFTSDHGTMLGEQNELHKGIHRLRHQCTRLPLFVRVPGQPHREVCGFVQHQDIMPTALALLGQPIPERVLGRSVWPQVLGQEAGPEAVVTAFGPYASYRTQRWNYLCPWTDPGPRMGPPRRELYDLGADPLELTNVIGAHADVAEELAGHLEAHLRRFAPLTAGTCQGSAGAGEVSFDALPRFREV